MGHDEQIFFGVYFALLGLGLLIFHGRVERIGLRWLRTLYGSYFPGAQYWLNRISVFFCGVVFLVVGSFLLFVAFGK